MTIHLYASVTPKPEHVAQVEAELRALVAATRKEPGNLRYDLLRRANGAPGFDLFESYEDAAALQAHRDSAHFNAFVAKVGAWLAGPGEIRETIGVDVAP